MTSDLVKWLFERKAIFALVCVVCLTVLRALEHLSDATFASCFVTLVGGFLTASVMSDKTTTPETPK